MTRAEILRELDRLESGIRELKEQLLKPETPIERYGRASYFKEAYGIKDTTHQTRRDEIRKLIEKGRYPKSAICGNMIDKAVYRDYEKYKKHLRICPKDVPPYDPETSFREVIEFERWRNGD